MTDAELAARLVETAGQLLVAVRQSALLSGDRLGKAGDHIANQFLIHALRAARPDDAILSEEVQCDGSRIGRERTWIIDPVDGTAEYGEDRDDWAVHVGLAIDGGGVQAARLILRHKPPSATISRAALCPGAPVTPPPGCVPEPHM